MTNLLIAKLCVYVRLQLMAAMEAQLEREQATAAAARAEAQALRFEAAQAREQAAQVRIHCGHHPTQPAA